MLHSTYRHAAYFSPALDSQAWQLGSHWLGRNAHQLVAIKQPEFKGLSAQFFEQVTRAPRLYGWHATLKAPFELNSNVSLEDLRNAFKKLSFDSVNAFHVPMKLDDMGDFLALVPSHYSQELQALADICVHALHPLALPLSEAEIQRRSSSGLTARQHELLAQWAYPFVMDQFQFHMTIKGSLKDCDPQHKDGLKAAAIEWFAPILENGMNIDAVTWFSQDQKHGDFRWVERFELGPSNCA